MPPSSPPSSPAATLNAYLDDTMGVCFDALSRFATPLFELYGIDLQASLAKPDAARSRQELTVLVTALDTARLLWAYFRLDEDDQDTYADAVKACLVGTAPDPDAEASFRELMGLMRERWAALPEALRRHAQDTAPAPLPDIETLLDQHGGTTASTTPQQGYGPDQLEQPEALALFAQPLIDDPAVHADPDRLEERMALATALWELAHTPPAHRTDALSDVLHRFADTPAERDRLHEQAHAMLDRFAQLFPEHA